MNSCGCSNRDYNYGEEDNGMNEQCLYNGNNFSGEGFNSSNRPSNLGNGNGYRENNIQTQRVQGQVRKCNNQYAINGRNVVVDNKNYYNNYYTRYNHYYINETNCVQDFLQDCNIYHYTTQTVYNGCKYLGSTSVVANDGCGNQSNNCCRPQCNNSSCC